MLLYMTMRSICDEPQPSNHITLICARLGRTECHMTSHLVDILHVALLGETITASISLSRSTSHLTHCSRDRSRKCGLFGTASAAFPKHVNFLLDECVHTGKGVNVVVSMLHYFFENYSIGECCMNLHADNCSWQNKNSCMMWYLM